MTLSAPTKPQIALEPYVSHRAAKNYVFHLLHAHIRAINPKRALDAGAGELRTLMMFPGEYVGITLNKDAFLRGLAREPNPRVVAKRGSPKVYLMRLEEDFSFLGSFDLCVSTFTLSYVEDRWDVVRRLADRVNEGGTLIFEGPIEALDRHCADLAPHFHRVDVIYWGSPGWDVETYGDEFKAMSAAEVQAPNVRAGHEMFYLFANGKKTPPGAAGPPPDLRMEDGLTIVTRDRPYAVRSG